ncbi:MAG: hypothetical protein ACTSR9_12770 [Candidatus Thorarchaeota archaeon]
MTFVGAGPGVATTSSIEPQYPSGLLSGDLIILQVMVRDTSNTPATPAGFTLLFGADSNTGDAKQWLYYRFSDGTESGSVVVSIGGASTRMGRMYAFRNVASTSWYTDTDYGAGTTDIVYANDVTTTIDKGLAVAFCFIQDNNEVTHFTGETGGDWTEVVEDFETFLGSDGLIGINAATMSSAGTISGGTFDMGRPDPWGLRSFALLPAAGGGDNYEIDLEYQWTDAQVGEDNAEVCINIGTHTGSEDLKVQYYDGGWVDLGTVSGTLDNGWVNITAECTITSTYTIRLVGASEISDTSLDDWDINEIVLHTWSTSPDDYEVSVEIEWSDINWDEVNREVCIYLNSRIGSESLQVYYYDAGWSSLGTVSSLGWTNLTATGLTSSSYKIRLNGSIEVADSSPDTWEITNVLIHSWTDPVTNHEMEVEFLWDAVVSADRTDLCINIASPISESVSVQYEVSQDTWMSLGTISTTGWTNFTDITIGSSQYTVRLVGANEVGDSVQDFWDIDVMILESTSVVTALDAFDTYTEILGTLSNYLLGQQVGSGDMELTEDDNGTPRMDDYDGVDDYFIWSGLIGLFSNAQLLDGNIMTLTEGDNGSAGFNNEHAVDNNTSNVDATVPANKGTDTFGTGPWSITEENTGGGGGGIVTLAGHSVNEGMLATSVSVAKPIDTASGDLLIVVCTTDGTGSALAGPSGFSVLLSESQSGSQTTATWYREADGTEGTSFTVSWTGDEDAVIGCFRITGWDNTNFPHASASSVGSGDPVFPSVATTVDNALVLRIYGMDDDDDTEPISGVPSGHTELYARATGSRNGEVTGAACHMTQTIAGDTGTATWDQGSGEGWYVATIAIAPEGGSGDNFEVDLEYQFTSVSASELSAINKEVCIDVSAHNGTEGLKVQYYNGAWIDLGTISSTGWTNFTAIGLSSTYTIRLVGAAESSDADPEYWDINTITLHTWTEPASNYVFETKFEWSSADYYQDNEEVCIYVSEGSEENLSIDYWTGNDWSQLGSGVVSSLGWNNYTASGLTGTNYTIRLTGSAEIGDTILDSWMIDVITLHTWTDAVINYEVNVEFNWNTAQYQADMKEVCIYVSSHAGNDNLTVQYEDSGWHTLGTVSTLGWTNLTAQGLTSTNYKIRLLGTTETSDVMEDTWNITFIGILTKEIDTSSEESIDYITGLVNLWDTDLQNSFTWLWEDGDTYGILDATVGSAIASRSVSSQDNEVYLRWRYNSTGVPSEDSYQLIITHAGLNYTINLLEGMGVSSGLSPWYVMKIDLLELVSDFNRIEAIALQALHGQLHVSYVAILPYCGFATTGNIEPDSMIDATYISWSSIGFETDASIFSFNGIDYFVANESILKFGLEADASCTYSIVLHGINSNQQLQVPETISNGELSIVTGRNDIELILRDYLVNIDIITDIEVRVEGFLKHIDFDYLYLFEKTRLRIDDDVDLWEIYLFDCYGFSLENSVGLTAVVDFDKLVFSPLTHTPESIYTLEMFVGYANYSMTGSASNTVAFLNDGLPASVWWSPNDALGVYTDGRTLNLVIETPQMTVNIGENETTVVLDEVEILYMDSLMIELMLTGWFNGTRIVRNYTVTSTGMVNWTTCYGTGVETMEAVQVWTNVVTATPLTELSLMEDVSEIIPQSVNIANLNTDIPLTEGEFSVKMNRASTLVGQFNVDFEDFALLDERYLHLSLKVDSGIDTLNLQLQTLEGQLVDCLSEDGDSDWTIGGEIPESVVFEVWIDLLFGLDTANYSLTVDYLKVSFDGVVSGAFLWIDDVFTSSISDSGQDDLRWNVLSSSTMESEGYLVDTSYTDVESISLVRGTTTSGVTVFSGIMPLILDYTNDTAVFSLDTDIVLGGTTITTFGSLFAGSDVDSPIAFDGTPLQENELIDLVEYRTLHYIADLTINEHVNITYSFTNGAGGLCGPSELSVVVSTLNVTGLGIPSSPSVYYLNLSADYKGGIYINALDVLLRLDTEEYEWPSLYKVIVDVGTSVAPTIRTVGLDAVTPLVGYTRLGMKSSALTNEYSGVTYDPYLNANSGYIENWIASPRDVDSRGLSIQNWMFTHRMRREIPQSVLEEDDIQVQFYLKDLNHEFSTAFDSGWFQFITLEDKVNGYALDISLSVQAPGRSNRIVHVFQRPVYGKIGAVGSIPLASDYASYTEMQNLWTLWTISFKIGNPLLKVEALDSNFDVTGTLMELDSAINLHTITAIELGDPKYYTPEPEEDGPWSVVMDDLNIYSEGHTVFRETFDAPVVSTLLGWDVAGDGWGISMKEGSFWNVGSSEPILGIRPEILASPNSISAWLEFCNGWYRTTRYEDTFYPGYLSGYTYEMESSGYSTDEYYQHYHTILDIGTTGLYEFEIEAITPSDIDNWILYIDGVDSEIVSGTATKYLRQGLHTVQLTIAKSGSTGSGHHNAFRIRLEKNNLGVTDAQAFLAQHGRYTAVYYDWEHSQRLGTEKAPSFYDSTTTAQYHAETLMGAGPMVGPVVAMGAQQLAEYMLRDILTARYRAGESTLSPMVTTAGKVLFSSDMVPSTIFTGEDSGSILEAFFETFGYVLVDGNKPFSTVSHPDGTTSQVDDSVLKVLDITEDTVYVTDDHYDHYSYLDSDSDHSFLHRDVANSWGRYNSYRIPMCMGLADSRLYTADFSTQGFTLYRDNMGVLDPIYTDADSAFVIPPGDLTLKFLISTTSSYLTFDLLGGDLFGDDVSDGSIRTHTNVITEYTESFENIQDSPSVRHIPTEFLKHIPSEFATDPDRRFIEISIPLETERYLTTTMFTTEMITEFMLQHDPFEYCDLVGIEVVDSFNVYAGDGLNERMILPVSSSGTLSDISFATAKPIRTMAVGGGIPVNFEVYDPTNPPTPTVSFSLDAPNLSSHQYYLESEDLTSQDVLLFDTPFDSTDDVGIPKPQYTMRITESTGSAALWMRYLWKVRAEDGTYTTGPDQTRWAAIAPIGIARTSTATLPTDIGRMLPAELDDFSPMYCLDTQKLQQQGRKYIDYAGYGNQYATMANPVTLQADDLGGGILSYGLSTLITVDHVVTNSSISGVFQQMVASNNFMNLWGASPKTDTVSDVRLGIKEYDELVVVGQQGWINEWSDGNGVLDTYERYGVDENGADWYSSPYVGERAYHFSDTLELRQPSQELTTWDADGTRLAAELGFLENLFDHPLIRYPMVQAEYIEFDLDMVDIQDELAAGDLYLRVELRIRDIPYVKEVTLSSGCDPTIRFDLEELSPEVNTMGLPRAAASWAAEAQKQYENRILYNSRDPEIEVSSPLLITTIYRDDPATLAAGDTLAHVNNLVYFDYHYQRIKIDSDYVNEYRALWSTVQLNHAIMKPIIITVGCIFVAAGSFTIASTTGLGAFAGVPTVVFGLDMIFGNTLGFSVLDENLKALLRGAFAVTGKDGNFIGAGHEFSFFQFTTSSVANLLLTQLTFMIVGGVLSAGAGFRGTIRNAMKGLSVDKTEQLAASASDAFLWLEGLRTGTSTISGAFRTLGTAGRLGQTAMRYIWHHAKHFLTGTMFLFTLGTIGTAFGDGGLFAQVAFQALLVASMLVSVGQQRALQNDPTGAYLYESAMDFVENEVGTYRGFFGRKISQLKESWSIIKQFGNPTLQQSTRMLMAINLASIGLQVATVVARTYGAMN